MFFSDYMKTTEVDLMLIFFLLEVPPLLTYNRVQCFHGIARNGQKPCDSVPATVAEMGRNNSETWQLQPFSCQVYFTHGAGY